MVEYEVPAANKKSVTTIDAPIIEQLELLTLLLPNVSGFASRRRRAVVAGSVHERGSACEVLLLLL
jgi:hypothetical protein